MNIQNELLVLIKEVAGLKVQVSAMWKGVGLIGISMLLQIIIPFFRKNGKNKQTNQEVKDV